MTNLHLEETLQRDINQIRSNVVEMANLIERALKASMQALVNRNRQLAYSVILRDQYIDELETELDRLCLEFIARQQPVAGHLRFVFATIQINRELERIGDYAESIARQAITVSQIEPQPPYERFTELGNLTVHMLRDAVQSYVLRDADLATRTMPIEERANTMRNAINGELKELNESNRLPAASVAPLMTVARRLERAADQAKNLCEEVIYMCTGEFSKHKGAEGFRILFLDSTNSGLSQMAEGIGTALRLPRFVFASAGVTPEPVDPRVVEFMSSKGIDISRQVSKSLEQVQGWENYQLIITLDSQAAEALPDSSSKTIRLGWSVNDPLLAPGPPASLASSFALAFQSLEAQLKELVGAILQEPQPELKL